MKKFIAIAVITLIVGCSAQPKVQTGPDAETTFDGLVRIDNSRFSNAWIDPDVDLSLYNKVMPGGAEFEFRSVQKVSSAAARRSNENEFWMSDSAKERVVETVSAVFEEELARSEHFEVVHEAGPETLIIVGAMHDIVSRVPPDHIGRGAIFLRSVGEATLIIELSDSLSGEVIYRAVDRRAAESSTATRSNSASNQAEVRRLARRWATRLREGLDSIHE